MAYLYGDSTESPVDFNYIEFLRDALDFSVEILVAEHRVQALQEGGDEKKRQIDVELGLLRQLSENVQLALSEPVGGPQTAAHRCVSQIRSSAEELIKRSGAQLKQSVADHLGQISAQVLRERSSNMRALEMLLRTRDLPDSHHHVEVSLDSVGSGYSAQMRGKADIGLEWVQGLDIPTTHLFAHLVKVEKLSPNLEVRVPEKAGWMRKGMRMRTHRIAGKYITEVVRSANQTTVKLRENAADDESGYNVLVTVMEPRVRLVRVQKGGEHSPPFEPLDEDVPKFLELASQLVDAAEELTATRSSLKEARLDGKTLNEHETPSLLVKRLITKMAPVVQEIARRSLSPDELILKRVLAGDRREEIFASKADLLGKLDPVPLALRGVFAPLGLGDLGRGANGRPSPDRPLVPERPLAPRPSTFDLGPDPDTKEITIIPARDAILPSRPTEPMRSAVDALRVGIAAATTMPATGPGSGRVPGAFGATGTIPPPPGYGQVPPPRPGPTQPPPVGVPTPARVGPTQPTHILSSAHIPPPTPPGAPRGGGTRPGFGEKATIDEALSAPTPSRPSDDEDITVVAAQPAKRAPPAKPAEDSIDAALNDLEGD